MAFVQYNPWADINATGSTMAGVLGQLMLGMAQEKARQRELQASMGMRQQELGVQQNYLKLAQDREAREADQGALNFGLRQREEARVAEGQRVSTMLRKNAEAREMARFGHEKTMWPQDTRLAKAKVDEAQALATEHQARADWYKGGGNATQRVASELFRLEQQRLSFLKSIDANPNLTPSAKARLAQTTNLRFNRVADALRQGNVMMAPQSDAGQAPASGGSFEYDPSTDQMTAKQ